MSYHETESNVVLLHLKGLPSSFCDAQNVRKLLSDVAIPAGEVHVLGGRYGQVFIKVFSAEEAIKALRHNGQMVEDHKVEILLSDINKKLKVLEEFRDEGRPLAVATASLIRRLTLDEAELKTASEAAKSDVESIDQGQKSQIMDAESRMMDDKAVEDFAAALKEGLASRRSSMGENNIDRQRGPLLPLPAKIPPLCPEFSAPPPAVLPLTRGGYWVSCKNIPATWEANQFNDLLIINMGITYGTFMVEKMMNDEAYVVFCDKEAYMKFLKCVGYFTDSEVPKLDDSVLCGITALPRAECHFVVQKMQEDRQKLFNGPNSERHSRPMQRGHFRGYRGSRFHSDHRPHSPRGRPEDSNSRGFFARRGRNFRSGFRGKFDRESTYRQGSRFSPENDRREPEKEEKVETEESPKKMARGELSPQDLRHRIRGSSTSSSDSKSTSTGWRDEPKKRRHGEKGERKMDRQGYESNPDTNKIQNRKRAFEENPYEPRVRRQSEKFKKWNPNREIHGSYGSKNEDMNRKSVHRRDHREDK